MDEDTPREGVVKTIAAKCRRCYNCVRSCPAKAIRVQSGQAFVLAERCIGCGNCIKVCAQKAKQVQAAGPMVDEMLASGEPVVAILAPSYPAAYAGLTAGQVVAALRRLGFARVMEVGFGAEMVAREYSRILKQPQGGPLISTPCPALVTYVEKYMPDLVPSLAPIVSPMVAMGRAVKGRYAPGARVVFIGPCIAKKAELGEPAVADAVDAAMTFQELEEMLAGRGLAAEGLDGELADEPLPCLGALFPVPGGLLKAAAVQADLMDDDIVVVEGAQACVAALEALRRGEFHARFLDALLCEGCIAGPAYSDGATPLARRSRVTAHVRGLRARARRVPRSLREVAGVEVRRGFRGAPIPLSDPTEREISDILARVNKLGPEDELNCGACGYATCRDKAVAVYQGLAESEMCLPYLIDQLQVNLARLTRSKEEIERAREQALRAQQLASMGELAADIAQEVGDPLQRIVAFAQLLRDGMSADSAQREDVAAVIAEASHCRDVMASLRCFARQGEPQWAEARVADIVAAAVDRVRPRLERAGVGLALKIDESLPAIVADPAQIAQALEKVLVNSVEASEGWEPGEGREPGEYRGLIEIEARRAEEGRSVEILVRDNGRGIDPALLPRVIQPFVTTKTGLPGAGLGLAVAHGVLEGHGGYLDLRSRPGRGTEVSLRLPLDLKPPSAREAIKVLVVDDDPDFLEQHRIMLDAMGFEVVTAERSDEAQEVASREIPDAFVLDLMMERTDSGARLARTLRRDPRFRRAPIIILTSVVQEMGFEFSRNPSEVLEWMKADAWFDKPAPVAEMASTIRRLLTREGEADTEGASESAPAGAGGLAPREAGGEKR